MITIVEQARRCKAAAPALAQASQGQKNAALEAIAQALLARQEEILAANAQDLARGRENGLREALLDRLALDPRRLEDMAKGVREVAALPDPVGEILDGRTLPNGLVIQRRRVPLGVVGIIYEARPNVTVDAAALCLKSGNAVLLRGGKEAIGSNLALGRVMSEALEQAGLSPDLAAVCQDTSRETADRMMELTEYLDVLIPRGGAGLIRAVSQKARVPVIRTGEGVCHIYVDKTADPAMAASILFNAKCSRPSVCNAAECVLVHRAAAEDFWRAALPLLEEKKVELRCCSATLRHVPGGRPAGEEDWGMEYGDYILAAREVESLEEALAHIARYGTGHSEAIVTRDYESAQRFLNEVDAAAVYVNASTRFTDGGQFGLGAEIGISTQKLHARGPMGLTALTSTKYLIRGQGQVR